MKTTEGKTRRALYGAKIVFARPPYIALGLATTVVFVFVFNLLGSGNTFLQLLLSLPWLEKFSVVGEVYLNFLQNICSLDRILMLGLAISQGILISLIVFAGRRLHRVDENSVLGSGAAAFLALVGAGCPICGGSIITAVFATVVGGSAQFLVQTVALAVMALAFIPIFFALRHQGALCYNLYHERSKNDKK
ncbi:MAG: hypothetical protein LBC95_00630 [Candidatus Nomurabacteria bacterium]|nr:hypothetical protein [Candidatus Nomurabacteria bacterium]